MQAAINMAEDDHSSPTSINVSSTARVRPRVLVADDNSGVLDFVGRLLSPDCDVTLVANGDIALGASLEDPPESHAATASIPIVLLCAESGEESLAVTDARGRPLDANRAACDLLGYTLEELKTLSPEDVLVSNELLQVPELLQLSVQDLECHHTLDAIRDFHHRTKQGVVEVEGLHRRKDGSTFAVDIRLTSLEPAPRHLVLAIVRDISERKRLEQERADEVRRKDEFLAFLGHELRNPLAAIHTAVQVLSSDTSPSQRAKMEEIIGHQTATMRRLVDDLLDLERITHGHIELKLQRVDLAQCLQAAVSAVQPTVAARQQALVLHRS
jgi:signal transduction histidine kinase